MCFFGENNTKKSITGLTKPTALKTLKTNLMYKKVTHKHLTNTVSFVCALIILFNFCHGEYTMVLVLDGSSEHVANV